MRKNKEIINLIIDLRLKRKMSLTELAKLTGIAKSSLSRYENGSREFPVNKVNNFAKALNVTPEYLLGIEPDNNINNIYKQLNNDRQKTVYDFAKSQLDEQNNQNNNILQIHEPAHELQLAGVVSAGTGEFQTDDLESETVMYYGTIPPHDYALRVNGDSMAPMLEDQQIIFVNKSNGASVRTGQIIIAILNGCSYVKKIDLANNSIRLVSLNSKYKPINITSTDNFKIQGIVSL